MKHPETRKDFRVFLQGRSGESWKIDKGICNSYNK